jgi:hypothetical protein
MGRISYVCAECSEYFTRKTSGKRHNFNIHSGRAEIVSLMEYLVGRGSGKYHPSHPSWFKRNERNWSFHPGKSYPLDKVVSDSTSGQFAPVINRPQVIHNYYERNSLDFSNLRNKFRSRLLFRSVLPSNTMHLLLELETLLYKHSNYYDNASRILQNAINQCSSGDEKFLFDMLDRLRILDRHS